MGAGYVIGIDAGGTKVAYALFDRDRRMIGHIQHPTDMNADGPAFSDALIASVHALLSKHNLDMNDLDGIGVCMPSFLLYDEGIVFMTAAMPGVRDFAMRDYLEARLMTRVVLDNDSNVAALAEHRYGAGRGARHMVYVALSTGIGCGILIDGKLFRGSYGWAGECGHMLITPDEGLSCGCRNQGCFMSYASGRYACAHAKARLAAGQPSMLSRCEDVTGERLLEATLQGDELARDIVKQMAHYIAVCLFNTYQLLNINLFVFGGGLVNFGEHLFGPVRAEFDRYNRVPKPVEFRFAELKQHFGVIGAAELIRGL